MAAGSTAGLIDLTNDQATDCQVIDLTASPSPPPFAFHPLKPDHSPKTPVCIGQLHVNALILYHIHYLFSRNPVLGNEWATVRLHPDPRSIPGSETIHLRAPTERTPTGIIIPGEQFGVLEQKAAKSIGEMLSKGLIRIEAKIRRGNSPVRSFLSFVLPAQACSPSPRPAPYHADVFTCAHPKGKRHSRRKAFTPA